MEDESIIEALRTGYVRIISVFTISVDGFAFTLSSLSLDKFRSLDSSSSADLGISGYACFAHFQFFCLGPLLRSSSVGLLTFCVLWYINHFQFC